MTVHQTPGDLHPLRPVRTGDEAERVAFEAWAKANLLPLTIWEDHAGLYYADEQTYAAWGAWQASTERQKPSLVSEEGPEHEGGTVRTIPSGVHILAERQGSYGEKPSSTATQIGDVSVPPETAAGATQQDHHKGLKTTDPVVLAVIDKLDERSAAGKLKYGTDLTRGDLSGLDWLRHLQEELLDAANYLQRIMNDVEQGR